MLERVVIAAREYIKGGMSLPSKEEMLKEWEEDIAKVV
jgi:hypothetical protein